MLVALAWEYACEERHGLRKAPLGISWDRSLIKDITRFWVQDWVQPIEGRMAFPVRKRQQIRHLAYLLHGYEPEGREFESPPGAPL